MSIESSIFDALKSLVSNRVYPDIAPEGTTRPYITYQQIGGSVVNYLDPTTPGARNGEFQINVWADTRAAAIALAISAESALRLAAPINARPLSAFHADHEADTGLYGTVQDFSVWEGS